MFSSLKSVKGWLGSQTTPAPASPKSSGPTTSSPGSTSIDLTSGQSATETSPSNVTAATSALSPELSNTSSAPVNQSNPNDEKLTNEQATAPDASSGATSVDMSASMYGVGDDLKKSFSSAKGFFKSWGTSAVSKIASKTPTIIKEVPIIGGFQKEQEEFIRTQTSGPERPVLPWAGAANEDILKRQILALSLEERNFVRNPPSGIQFQFDMKASTPLAMLLLQQDPNLAAMRFKLVPKRVKEDAFWRNYMYRISLIKQSASMSSFAKQMKQSQIQNQTQNSSLGAPDSDALSRSTEGSPSPTYQSEDAPVIVSSESLSQSEMDPETEELVHSPSVVKPDASELAQLGLEPKSLTQPKGPLAGQDSSASHGSQKIASPLTKGEHAATKSRANSNNSSPAPAAQPQAQAQPSPRSSGASSANRASSSPTPSSKSSNGNDWSTGEGNGHGAEGGNGNGGGETESGSEWEKDFMRELEIEVAATEVKGTKGAKPATAGKTSANPELIDEDELIEREILQQIEAEKRLTKP